MCLKVLGAGELQVLGVGDRVRVNRRGRSAGVRLSDQGGLIALTIREQEALLSPAQCLLPFTFTGK